MEWKRCTRCDQRKPDIEFYRNEVGVVLTSVCIACCVNKPLKKNQAIADERNNLQKQEVIRTQREQQKLDMQRKLIESGLIDPLGL
ncbi:MAG: hypothetical protein WC052_04700 [Patescibacteria group bacterium]